LELETWKRLGELSWGLGAWLPDCVFHLFFEQGYFLLRFISLYLAHL